MSDFKARLRTTKAKGRDSALDIVDLVKHQPADMAITFGLGVIVGVIVMLAI